MMAITYLSVQPTISQEALDKKAEEERARRHDSFTATDSGFSKARADLTWVKNAAKTTPPKKQ